ncbi:MAG: alpha/beta hydrolase [Planctomycetes bacterium]|nr:alpha/beta hydrolase [Planctomycetota bacterium]
MKRKAGLRVLGVLGVVAVLALLQGLPRIGAWLILHPYRRANRETPSERGWPQEDLRLKGEDGLDLAAWLVPAEGPSRGTVVYVHGHNDNRWRGLRYVEVLRPLGLDVLLYEQRAHGESGGELCTYGWRERHDLVRVLDWVEARAPGRPVGVLGVSLGGSVAVQGVALDPRVDALISACPYADLRRVVGDYARRWFGPLATPSRVERALALAGERGGFPPAEVDTVASARGVRAPTLVIHGSADDQVLFAYGREVYEACGAPVKEFLRVEGAGHGDEDLWREPAYRAAIPTWFERHLVTAPGER